MDALKVKDCLYNMRAWRHCCPMWPLRRIWIMLVVTLSVLLIKEKGTCDPFLAEVKHQYNEQKNLQKQSKWDYENLNRQGNGDAEKNTNLLTYKKVICVIYQVHECFVIQLYDKQGWKVPWIPANLQKEIVPIFFVLKKNKFFPLNHKGNEWKLNEKYLLQFL